MNDDQKLSPAADRLNQGCFCFGLEAGAIERAIEAEIGDGVLGNLLRERCPTVFAAQPVFVGTAQLKRMADLIGAIETVVALPAYRESVLQDAPEIARIGKAGPRSVFFGYDFHANGASLGLIEINTNAGGAMLNILLARAQRRSCPALSNLVPSAESAGAFEAAILAMFRHEWRLAGRTTTLMRIAVVDRTPESQYLYPEFLLFKRLFENAGIDAVVADPGSLAARDGKLWHGELPIDLVYNRLTDFYLEAPDSAAIREAYLHDAVVVTPHPQAHALYADKRRLAVFSDAGLLEKLGVPQDLRTLLLACVPHTRVVKAQDAGRLWEDRRHLFFKPAAGFGSRAAYRGDKLTRRVWGDILEGGYVAQAFVAPGERATAGDTGKPLKYDLRAYAYDGAVQWVAARLYQGQTTNFRTPGGGFAPVYSTPGSTQAGCCSTRSDDHVSYVFVLGEPESVHPLPHTLYVALARGEATAPDWAGVTVRLADWYVRMDGDRPDALVGETYTFMSFDTQGRVDWPSTPAPHPGRPDVRYVTEDQARPTAAQRDQMSRFVFGGTDTSGSAR